MKTKILYRIWVVLAITVVVYACKKSDSKSSDNGTSNTDLQTQSDDQTQVTNENDYMLGDVNAVVEAAGTTTGAVEPAVYRPGVKVESPYPVFHNPLCDGTVAFDTANGDHKLVITYNGTACPNSGHTRTGVVSISWAAGQRWFTKGSTLTLSIQNLKITRTRDNKSITLNGTHTYTNVTGGNLLNIANEDSVVHTVTSSDMTVTFDNNTTRTWNVARQLKFTHLNSSYELQISGTHTDGNTTGISEWGTNRLGNTFETVITAPLTITTTCYFQITSGQVQIIQPSVTTTATFGLDSGGNPIGCSDTGLYFKIVFTGAGGKSYTFILPY